MTPAIIKPASHRLQNDGPDVQPGTWWRLKDPDHDFADRYAPDHGLVLMVQEARVVDGELHTIVLHAHPVWLHEKKNYVTRLLIDDFLSAFIPEPDGEALREIEIAAVMGRVTGLSQEIASPPPDPVLLAQTKTDAPNTPADPVPMRLASGALIPASLLPSQDVIHAQSVIENQIAIFEARRNWIVAKTDELRSEMGLVAGFQTEKVGVALAGISQQTSRAQGLLKSVQTMRLFLGEDTEIVSLRDGPGADPSEPLTFMQQLLYLDEELFIHDLTEGFHGDMMGDLGQVLQADMKLVERMLPTPRCVCITRVRRQARKTVIEAGAGIKEIIGAIFKDAKMAEADSLIQILVRDGERVHMLIADEATSHATRLFPSRTEIDALFTGRGPNGKREITPTDLDYTDARGKHDDRALFYKRFLLILWGMHERSDVFGDFLPKGANWLDETIHSDRFRFIHDEEGVLTDGRPSIDSYIAAANDRMAPGSQCVVRWRSAATPDTAPGVVRYRREDQYDWLAEFAEDWSTVIVAREDGRLKATARVLKGRGRWDRDSRTSVNSKVTLRGPSGWTNRAHNMFDQRVSDGVLCIDDMTLADMDYYINSRRAREGYGRWLHLFNEARGVVKAAEKRTEELTVEMLPPLSPIDRTTFARAMKLWRAGAKWGWPDTAKDRAAVLELCTRMTKTRAIADLAARHLRVLSAGLKANGDIYVLTDDNPKALPGDLELPWLHETVYADPGSTKPKTTRLVSWFDMDTPDRLAVHFGCVTPEDVKTRMTRPVEAEEGFGSDKTTVTRQNWRVPLAFRDISAAAALATNVAPRETVEMALSVFQGDNRAACLNWLKLASHNRKLSRIDKNFSQSVEMPLISIDAGLVMGVDHAGMPQCAILTLSFKARDVAVALGYDDDVHAWLSQNYAKPDLLLERTQEDVARMGPLHDIVTLSLRAATGETSLSRMFSDAPQPVFETLGNPLVSYAIPDGLTWRERAAILVTAPERKNWQSKYTAEALKAQVGNIHIIGAPGVEELVASAFDLRKR